MLSTNGQQREQRRPTDVAPHHHPAPVEPVDDDAADGAEEEAGHDARHHHEADGRARVVGDTGRDREDRDQADPVAGARDDLRDPEAEVRAGPEDPPRRGRDGRVVGPRRDEGSLAGPRSRRDQARGVGVRGRDTGPRVRRSSAFVGHRPRRRALAHGCASCGSAAFFARARLRRGRRLLGRVRFFAVFLVVFFAVFFVRLLRRAARLRSRSSSTACSRSISAGSTPRGTVALIVPSVTYGPNRPSSTRTGAPVVGVRRRAPRSAASSGRRGASAARRAPRPRAIVTVKSCSSLSRLRLSLPFLRYGP